jgi:hypothetical protein
LTPRAARLGGYVSKSWSFQSSLLTSVLTVSLVGLGWWIWHTQGPRDDAGDRPPIIISEGSADVYLGHGKKGRGRWEPVSNLLFTNVPPPNSVVPTEFNVYVIGAQNADANSTGCDSPNTPFIDTEFTVEFNANKKVAFKVDSTGLKVAFSEAGAMIDTANAWLSWTGAGNKLTGIKFPNLKMACLWKGNPHRAVVEAYPK